MAQQTKRRKQTNSRTRSNARKPASRDTVGSTAKQLRTPLIAAGTGLAGIAAGAALGRSRSKGRGTKKLGEVAKSIGMAAERAGKVAQQVRVASEAISDGDGSRRPKSPIEVVLEGLTSRRRSRAG